MAVEIFVRIVKRVFEKKIVSSQLAFPWSFLAMFLKSQPIDVNVIAHIEPPHSVKRLYKFSFESYGVFVRTSSCFKMTVENFVRMVLTVFEKNEKVNNWLFFGQFWLFLESQLYDINVIVHIGPPYNVKWLSNFSFESLRQFLEKNGNSSQLAFPWSFLAMFLKSQPIDVNVIAHIEPPQSVKRLYKFSFESYGVFERTSIYFKMTVESFIQMMLTVFEKN